MPFLCFSSAINHFKQMKLSRYNSVQKVQMVMNAAVTVMLMLSIASKHAMTVSLTTLSITTLDMIDLVMWALIC
jgi:hypothetical protein